VLLTLITETSVGLLDFGFNIRFLTPLGIKSIRIEDPLSVVKGPSEEWNIERTIERYMDNNRGMA
jgi:hypothetical protein